MKRYKISQLIRKKSDKLTFACRKKDLVSFQKISFQYAAERDMQIELCK